MKRRQWQGNEFDIKPLYVLRFEKEAELDTMNMVMSDHLLLFWM